MKLNTQEEFDAMFERFSRCCDGVLQLVQVRYLIPRSLRLELVVGTQDTQALEEHGWSSIRIVLEDVQGFTIRETRGQTIQVLSFGVSVRFLEGRVAVQFGSLSADECVSLEAIRKSDAYAIGAAIEVEVGLYESFLDFVLAAASEPDNQPRSLYVFSPYAVILHRILTRSGFKTIRDKLSHMRDA